MGHSIRPASFKRRCRNRCSLTILFDFSWEISPFLKAKARLAKIFAKATSTALISAVCNELSTVPYSTWTLYLVNTSPIHKFICFSFAVRNGKKVQTGLGNRGRLMVLNDTKLILNDFRVTQVNLGPIWYNSEPSNIPFSPN